jgi:putative ABC transport system permease protein
MLLKNLRASKMRSFLTMLGIIIGISSVIIVLSVGAGAESLIVNQIRSAGSNLVGVLPGGSDEDGPPAALFGIVITTLTNDDKRALEAQIPEVVAISSYVTTMEPVTYQNQKVTANIQGVSEGYLKISDSEVDQGRFLLDEDEKLLSNVAVLGSEIKEELFEDQDAIGQTIKIKKRNYKVIGVLQPKGVVTFQNTDKMIFLPVTTVQKKIVGINHVGFIRMEVDEEDNMEYVVSQAEEILRDRHNIDDPKKDDFDVANASATLESLTVVTSSLKYFLVAIAAISLIVGGVGIMNIMLAAVTERIKEVGLKKALGAKKKDIIWQFLVESVSITFFAAIIGIIIGVSFSFLTAVIVRSLGFDWDFVVTPTSLLLSCGVSITIGLIFGIYPANKASKFDPITALRYE